MAIDAICSSVNSTPFSYSVVSSFAFMRKPLLVDGDVISISRTSLLFTDEDCDDRDSSLRHYRKTEERMRVTSYAPRESGVDQ